MFIKIARVTLIALSHVNANVGSDKTRTAATRLIHVPHSLEQTEAANVPLVDLPAG
ncbi:hypothetical protein [Stutzerimonas xanthomarina]|uniref:hypothetical protein n=1 Tax=Stutzerimonas xanthomarina TaxID=271420 RepID=UPI003AA85B28